MKPLLITSGEPAGIGPDLCLALAGHPFPLVILANQSILEARARQLNLSITFEMYQPNQPVMPRAGKLTIWSIDCEQPVIPGQIDIKQATYVLKMLDLAVDACLSQQFSALVTAPVHKAVINQAGFAFTGHTEWLARRCQSESVVMLMVSPQMRVALVTTHLPLRAVPDALTQPLLMQVLRTLQTALQRDFGLKKPKIRVAGLNPHAGEGGYLGTEEQTIILPVIESLCQQGFLIEGPFPADTLFIKNNDPCDVYVTMYHDQGLPVIKHADFDHTVNVTLGLPIIRTSVDHGTALSLAGLGIARADSLLAAVDLASKMAIQREQCHARN